MQHLFLKQKQILICIGICVVSILSFLYMQVSNPIDSDYDYEKYKIEYQEYRSLVETRETDLFEISIFSDSDSYAVKNLDKTNQDYLDSSDVRIEELTGAQNAVAAFINAAALAPFCCLLVVVYHAMLYQKREECNRRLAFSLPKGRCWLAIHKIWTGYAITWIFSFFLYLEILLSSFCYYGGWKDLGVSVQSIDIFLQLHHDFLLGEYLLWYCAIKAFCIATFGLLFLMLLYILDHKIITAFLFVLILIGELVLANIIPIQGKWILLKILNLGSMIFCNDMMFSYRNIPTIFGLISNEELLYAFVFIAAFVSGVVIIIMSIRYAPTSYPAWVLYLIRFSDKVKDLRMTIEEKLSWLLMEIYIFLVHQRGWLICLAVLLITMVQYQKDDIIYSSENKYLEIFYQEWEGPVSDELMVYLADWKNEINEVDAEWRAVQEAFNVGEITFKEYDDAQYEYQAYEIDRKCYDIIANKVAFIQEYNIENTKELWLVNEIGYQHLFGNAGAKAIYFTNMLLIIMSFLISFSFLRRKNGTGSYLESSCKCGRKEWFLMQMKAAITIVIVFSMICFIAHLFYIISSYGLSAWNAPIQSLSGYENRIFPGSILLFYIVQLAKKVGINVGIVIIIMLFFSKVRSRKQ